MKNLTKSITKDIRQLFPRTMSPEGDKTWVIRMYNLKWAVIDNVRRHILSKPDL